MYNVYHGIYWLGGQSWFVKIYLRHHHALMVEKGAFSQKVDYVRILEILSPEGHPNRFTGSKVMAILLVNFAY